MKDRQGLPLSRLFLPGGSASVMDYDGKYFVSAFLFP
jgi:hypothetical protein